MLELTLLLHLTGFGLLFTALTGGFILHRQYRKAGDIGSKASILRSARPIGLLSPVAMAVMLVTGVGNVHGLGVGFFELGWLSAKLAVFALTVIGGVLLAVASRRRSALVMAMAEGKAPENGEARLASAERQISLGYFVMPLLLLIILSLTVIGRFGAQ